MNIESKLYKTWQDKVDNQYIYRGMSSVNLGDYLSPDNDPYEGWYKEIHIFYDVMQHLIDSGLEFDLKEEHFGNICYHKLSNIIKWSKRDLKDDGIDFTTDFNGAKEYSDCYQGSQMKQNINTIINHLLQNKSDKIIKNNLKASNWKLIQEIKDKLLKSNIEHQSIVLCIKRSLPIFVHSNYPLLLGSFENFKENLYQEIKRLNQSISPEIIDNIVKDNDVVFDFRLRSKLPKSDIEKIVVISKN